MANTKGGLGTKGLNALFNDNEENVKVDIADDIQAQEIDITLIDRNPNQPRKTFDEDSLREMSTSIATYGVLQPLLLVKTDGGRYLIIAGERRFRASLLAGLKKVPAIIREFTPQQIQENLAHRKLAPRRSQRNRSGRGYARAYGQPRSYARGSGKPYRQISSVRHQYSSPFATSRGSHGFGERGQTLAGTRKNSHLHRRQGLSRYARQSSLRQQAFRTRPRKPRPPLLHKKSNSVRTARYKSSSARTQRIRGRYEAHIRNQSQTCGQRPKGSYHNRLFQQGRPRQNLRAYPNLEVQRQTVI